ncbi:MAG: hypothetical protein OXH75_12140 [Acidobacteria bacterium]|nr:hypothetical protein [Acidobacteriota bacterium]
MIYLVHHGEAVPADVDAQRPLTRAGLGAVERLARETARRGAAPVEVWHSGKLRARQTGEAFRRACNARAAFTMVRGLRPADPSDILADRLAGETRDLLLVGHMPLIARLLRRLLARADERPFPPHGIVALEPDPAGDVTRWRESWRLGPDG